MIPLSSIIENGLSKYKKKECKKTFKNPIKPDFVKHKEPQLNSLNIHTRGDVSTLTDKQREVAILMALGHSNGEMAAKLDLSIKTIEKHRGLVYAKTGIHDIVKFTHFALARGLVKNLFSQEPNG